MSRKLSNISLHRRRLVHQRDGYCCRGCGDDYSTRRTKRVLRGGRWRTYGLEIDHIYPVSAGGTNAVENLQSLCTLCNARKGARVG